MTTIEHGTEFDTDLNLHAEEFCRDPYSKLAELQSRCPVAHSSAWGGFWLITGYDEVFEALQSPEIFSNAVLNEKGKGVPPAPGGEPLIPIDFDAPDLIFYRSFLLKAFSPGVAKGLEPLIQEVADEIIDGFIENGSADVSQELFTALPAQMILRILGFDYTRTAEWIVWVHGFVHDRASDPQGAFDKITAMYGAIHAEIAAARRDSPPGLMTELIAAEREGRTLTDGELANVVFLLILGGMDTTAGLAGNSLLRIGTDRALRQQILDDPAILDKEGTEEFLRHGTPSMGLARTVKRDVEFRGRSMKEGDAVLLMYSAANRDPEKFDDPEAIDLTRQNNRHMAFALGQHRCLGSNLARSMFRIMITSVLMRMPDFEVDVKQVVRYPDGGDVYAVKHFPITFTAGDRKGSVHSA
ncbi:UNVERIFIED_ORG: cytochrome P450 [Nocardia globerula]|uniref:Cytochrome P450 n=1 Tax=Nocardia globerula TaxID=1818 RepID=A0A652YSP1_NOCGL|nr:cytochrome P450 [Rhodococcus globerulus]NMD61357.1 cytochrome P450 [Nocardia globerula]PVX67092.1 cytochrome P450 [Rhodococcus globerulus]